MAMDLKAILSAEDHLTPVFDGVSKSGKKAADGINSAFEKSISIFDLVKKAAVGLGVSLSLYKLGESAKDAAMAAARYETLGVVMDVVGNNAG